MADGSAISWTDATWNPTRGCRRVSPGCEHCYAERQANRFKGPGKAYEGLVKLVSGKPRWTGATHFAVEQLAQPLSWRQPRRIFVDSMSDLFYEGFSNEQIAAVFGVMAACPQHTFQILTKRPARMREWFEWMTNALPTKTLGYDPRALACWDFTKIAAPHFASSAWDSDFMSRGHLVPWPLPNVWLGVSVENQAAAEERIPDLLATPATVRFLSCEPLLGPVDVSRWLGVNDVRQDQESGRVCVRGGQSGRNGDRLRGEDLACCETAGSEDRRNRVEHVQATASRTNARRLSERAGDDRWEAHDSACAPTRLVSSTRIDTKRPDHQSQERYEDRQPSEQSRDRDGLGATAARNARASQGASGESERREEPRCEANERSGQGDPRSSNERRVVEHDRGPVRDHVSTRLSDSARKNQIGWIISGCESGPGARPCDVEWLRSLRDQCASAGLPYFLKQALDVDGAMTAVAPPTPLEDQPGYSPRVGPFIPTIGFGPRSARKSRGVIELPYLDGVQHAAFPTVTP